MATCPKCGGFEADEHRCPKRIYARAAWRIGRAALVGAIAGSLVLVGLFGGLSWGAIVVAAAVGVLVDAGIST
jgi:hypothetical protein